MITEQAAVTRHVYAETNGGIGALGRVYIETNGGIRETLLHLRLSLLSSIATV